MAEAGTETPMRSSTFVKLCVENTVCRRSPVPARPTTSPYPISWFSRTPSSVTRSLSRVSGMPRLTSAARGVSAFPKPSDIRSNSTTHRKRIFISKGQQPQQYPVKDERPAYGVAHDSLSVQPDFHLAQVIGPYHVARREIRRSHYTAHRDCLMLGIDLNGFGSLDDQVAVGQHMCHARRQCGVERDVTAGCAG